MIQIVQQLLEKNGPELVRNLVAKAGFSSEEAQSFLPVAAEKLMAALQGGGLDIQDLLGGAGVASLLAKLNAGEIAADSGIDEAKATAGLGELVPNLLSALNEESGGAKRLLSALGGGKSDGLLGGAGSLTGKFFD
jgi:hypothetical protein